MFELKIIKENGNEELRHIGYDANVCRTDLPPGVKAIVYDPNYPQKSFEILMEDKAYVVNSSGKTQVVV